MNPAEYFVDLVSIDYSTPETEAASKQRIKLLADAFFKKYSNKYNTLFKKLKEESKHQKSKAIKPARRNSIILEIKKFGILFNRAWKQVTRDKSLNIARFMSGLFSGLLFGAIYFRLGAGASTVADRLGLLQVAAVNTAMTSLIKATTSFVTEKIIIQRERKSGSYSVASYFISKLLAEFPLSVLFPCMTGSIIYKLCGLNNSPGRLLLFNTVLVVESMASSAFGMAIGSIAPSVESAIATAPALMVIFIVFGGLYVVNAPSYLKWVPNCSLIRWAYEGLVINEFKDLTIIPEAKFGPKSVTSGNQVLDNMGIKKGRSIRSTLKSQLLIIAANYVFTYFSLLRQKPKIQEISKKDDDEDNNNLKNKTSKRSADKKKVLVPPPH
jgi:ABC-type multidrug transport system permease subunit